MCDLVPRLEFHSNIQWAQAYQRNNKANGQKNLRCFPNHCQGLGHQRGFCGHSIVINFYYLPQSIQGQLYSFAHFCIADCELNSPAAAAAKGVSRERFKPGDVLSIEQVRSKIRQADEPLLEYIEGLELQDRRIDADGSVRVNFEFNRNLKGWHYGFLGSKLTRNVYHNFRAYVLELIPGSAKRPEHYRVLAAVTSPKWKLFCRRRNRNGVLPPRIENGVPTKIQNAQQTRLPMNSPPLPVRRVKKRREAEVPRLQRHPASQPTTSLHHRTVPLQARRYPSDPASDCYSSGPEITVGNRHLSTQHNAYVSASSSSGPPSPYPGSHYDQYTMHQQQLHHNSAMDDYSEYTSGSSSSNNNNNNSNNARGHPGAPRPHAMPHTAMPSVWSEHATAAPPPPQAYPGVKQYVRRLASQERLTISGRSGFTKKRTSSESLEPASPSNSYQHQHNTRSGGQSWATCFDSNHLSRSQSIPQLEPFKGSNNGPNAATGTSKSLDEMTDPRQVCLYELLRMINFSTKNTEPRASLSLRDHGEFQHFSATALDLARHWLSVPSDKLGQPCAGPGIRRRSGRESNTARRAPCDDYLMDEVGFSKFLVEDERFGGRIVQFARDQPLEQRQHDPYGTVAFMLNLLKAYQNVFLGHVSQPDAEFLPRTAREEEKSTEETIGSLYPVMSTLSLRAGLDSLLEADRLTPRHTPRHQSHFNFNGVLSSSTGRHESGNTNSSASNSRRPNLTLNTLTTTPDSSLTESGNSGHEEDKLHSTTADLERFTQDLEHIATGNADDLTLRATKSWKSLSTAKLTHKLSHNFGSSLYGTKMSEHSLFNAASFLRPTPRNNNASIFSFSNLPSALNVLANDTVHGGSNANGEASLSKSTDKSSADRDRAARKKQNAESSMRELDEFLKKECGALEVEEVDVPSVTV